MRYFIIILFALFATPAFAQGWSEYSNARYGATAKVPPGFEPMGPEANNSDGLIYRSRKSAILTIFGADVPGSNFEAFVKSRIAFEKSYHGWNVSNTTITPDWAEYTGSVGSRFLSVRILSSCNGRQVVATKFEYNGSMSSIISKVERSLKAGPAKSCN